MVHNYKPTSLLICHTALEKTLFNSLFTTSLVTISIHLGENNLLCEHQSRCWPSEFCEYKLLSIVHDIYSSFDCNPPVGVRCVFGYV